MTPTLEVVWDGRRNGPRGALLLPPRDEHPSVLLQVGRRFAPGECSSEREGLRSRRRAALRAAGIDPKTVRHCTCGCGQRLPSHLQRVGRGLPIVLPGHVRLGGLSWAARQGDRV